MARYLLLADVHANLQALEAVFGDAARRGGFDSVWVLGDIVGYGPQPDECIERLREESMACVAGNHDLGVTGRADLDYFNSDAATVCMWSRSRLTVSSTRFLQELPLRQSEAPVLLVHGSPRDPVWEYVTSARQAAGLLAFCEEPHCFVGHTHCQAVFSMQGAPEGFAGVPAACPVVTLDGRMIVNPGSVGQPRDGDPRAAYAMYDTRDATVRFHRVSYDVRATSDLMLRLGLPAALARRLHAGY